MEYFLAVDLTLELSDVSVENQKLILEELKTWWESMEEKHPELCKSLTVENVEVV